jgi:hypothetical protein
MRMFKLLRNIKAITSAMLIGDWLIFIASSVLIIVLFQQLWSHERATTVQIRLGDTVYGTYSLNQQRDIHVKGTIGNATISIMNGKARFAQSPCHNQYCVHQGWLSRSGQAAICLPNQVSLELVGETKHYDSLNY